MLAAKLTEADLEGLRFPLYASPKLDGVRCVIKRGQALTRNLKPIPNFELRNRLESIKALEGCDGELVIPGAEFCYVTSAVMGRNAGSKLVEYWVFDRYHPTAPFSLRVAAPVFSIRELAIPDWVKLVPQVLVHSLVEVRALESNYLDNGFEGIMLRCPDAPYKCGRSTVREQGLMKLKRFCDSEAVIVGFVEQMRNVNAQIVDEVGRKKRSSAKAGKVPAKMLGAFQVRDLKTGVEFEIGSGFGTNQRMAWWKARRQLVGKIAKYRYQPVGVKDKPRFPVFLGLRDTRDM